jgi:hypothetical protein
MTLAAIIIPLIVALLGVMFGVRCYIELWRWARQCQNAKIAVAHKGRVQLVAPLAEWLTWANQLATDETSKGRVVYRNGHVSVAILRPTSTNRVRTAIARARNARRRKTAVET